MPRQIIVHMHRTADAARAATLIEDLANRMAAALEEVMGWAKAKDEFRESDHPRAPDGRFGNKAGEHGEADLSQPKPTTAKGANAKSRLRELLESEHPFTKAELMAIAGITNESTFTSWMSMMRNPKYAGKSGVLEIVKNKDGTYQARPKGTAAPAPTPGPAQPPAAPPAPKPSASIEALGAQYIKEKVKAHKLSATAKTAEQHSTAIKAHAQAINTLQEIITAGGANALGETKTVQQIQGFHARLIMGHTEQLRRLEEVKAKLPANEDESSKKIEARFAAHTPQFIHRELQSRFGLGLAFADLPKGGIAPRYGARGIRRVDIDAKTASAKEQRRMLGHVYEALEDLEKSGFDIKAALSEAKVEYAPGVPGSRMNGVAWQETTYTLSRGAVHPDEKIGRFTVSGKNRLGANAEQHQIHQRRISAGQPSWSRSSATLGNAATRTTIVHELVHALGMQPHLESPRRLEEILHQMHPSFVERKAWIKANISEYATANIRETDAELGAMVTDPSYKRGTLPKVLEDHVDWLFKKRAAK